MIRLDGNRDRITINLEVKEGFDQTMLSDAVRKSCQGIFELRMDNMKFTPKVVRPEGYQKFIGTSWE